MERTQKAFLHTKVWGCLEEKHYVFDLQAELVAFFSQYTVFLQIMTGRKTMVIQHEHLADVFS